MDWDKLRIFHAVAQAGSFTHAGEELHLSQSAVSRQVSALEDDLAVPLFHRHARGLILTEPGELLYRTAHEIFGKLSTVQAILSDSRAQPVGELRVTTTVGFGSTWLTPRIGEFMEAYPDIAVSLICDDRELDLGMREADVAIRMTMPTQPDLVKLRLCVVHTHLYAAPEYLARRGTPEALDDIDEHDLIVYGDEAPPSLRNVNWPLFIGVKAHNHRRPKLQVNNIYGLLLATENGLGIAALPDYMVYGNNRIVRVLPDLQGPSFDAFFVYPEELRNTKRIQVFRDFLSEAVRNWRF
ncbi:MAG: LysR family transcriptional regulator [Alphaproteobacteria bacterium]|jgi:DNA-binding transcriptional LysR family regulator|nr:LysR family transcriptional regulator [Alphaproteobacteria bacterium]